MAHTCHAVNCTIPVKPQLYMCKRHWGMVPAAIQKEIYKHYRNGQCDDKSPSIDWLRAAYKAKLWVCKLEKGNEQEAEAYNPDD